LLKCTSYEAAHYAVFTSPASRHFLPLRSKCPPQQPVLKHPYSVFLPYVFTRTVTLTINTETFRRCGKVKVKFSLCLNWVLCLEGA
jgi:hypothetical protein